MTKDVIGPVCPSRRRWVQGCLVSCLGGAHAAFCHALPTEKQAATDKVVRRLRFQIELRNPTGEVLAPQSLWAYAPIGLTQHQRLLGVDSTWPLSRQTDALGHTVLHWRTPPLSPHATRLIGLDATVDLSPQQLSEHLPPGAWLAAERHVERDSPAVRAQADALRRPTPRESVEAIYDWVRQHLEYAGYIADDWGAQRALEERRGDCTEYAYLVVALCRALGVPARALGGFVSTQDAAPVSSEYHNWAEVYLDGVWCLIDAQKEVLFDGMTSYVTFRRISERTLSPMGQAHRFLTDGPAIVRFR